MSIYDVERDLERLETHIQESNYPEVNKKLMQKYRNKLFARGLKTITVRNNLRRIHKLSGYLDKPFKEASLDDMEGYFGQLERHIQSEHSKSEHKSVVKRFFRWLYDGTEPECTSWISTRMSKSNRKMPSELLTGEEIKQMIAAANHPRDKALIAVLYDTGARISEIGNLRIKDVTFDQYGGVLQVNGKTGMRRVRIIFSVSYLSTWLDNHPNRQDTNDYVWITFGKRQNGNLMHYSTIRNNINQIAKKAGIKKRVYNHLFRHSRSTELAQHLTQAQMEEHLGWIHGSNMPQTYIHMSGKQVDDAILKMHGLKKDEETQPELTARQCPRCDEMNGPTSKFCSRCGAALDTQTAIEVDSGRSDIMTTFMELIQNNPEIASLLNQVKEQGENKEDN